MNDLLNTVLIINSIAWLIYILAKIVEHTSIDNPTDFKDKFVVWCYGTSFVMFITGLFIVFFVLPTQFIQ